jgi:putative AlgH/UPF0301 family transcriptional regulator
MFYRRSFIMICEDNKCLALGLVFKAKNTDQNSALRHTKHHNRTHRTHRTAIQKLESKQKEHRHYE